MASTFSNNGLELIATGEQEATWGETTNENLELIDEAIDGYYDISSSNTTQTLEITSGASSNGRHKILHFTGAPIGPVTATIDPNTAQKWYIVWNESGQPITITQGTGGNAVIESGSTALIFADGGGASARVFNLTDKFKMTGPVITGGTLTGVTISGSTINNNVTGNLTGNVTGSLLGTPTAPTPSTTDNNTRIATTAYVKNQLYATLLSPSLTGTPTAPTTADSDNSTRIATTAFVKNQEYAPLASPALTGTPYLASPTAVTPATATNNTQVATTAYVKNQGYLLAAEESPKGFICFDSQTAAVIASKNLTVQRLAEGTYRVVMDSSIRTGDLLYAAGVSAITSGRTSGTTFGATGIDVDAIGIVEYGTTYFDIRSTRSYNTGLAANGIGNDGNDSQRFAAVLLDARFGRVTAWVF